mmetsp:Transcript_1702/g.4790  ORF Transcript_1702/g.4790 Transcript_1702/m.4790 type:complete len:218 (+) Transcript_1702:374-1027(+)
MKASWSSSTSSRITRRFEDRSSPYSGQSLEKSSSPRRRMSTARLLSGRETRAPRLSPMPTLRTAMPMKVAKLMTRALCTISCSLYGRSTETTSITCCLVYVPLARKAPSGSTTATSHFVRKSRLTVSVATRMHSLSAPFSRSTPHSTSCGGFARASARLKTSLVPGYAAAMVAQVPYCASRARAVALTVSCEESSAFTWIPSRSSPGCPREDTMRLP